MAPSARTPCRVLRKGGAQAIVAGKLVFDAPDLGKRMEWLRSL